MPNGHKMAAIALELSSYTSIPSRSKDVSKASVEKCWPTLNCDSSPSLGIFLPLKKIRVSDEVEVE